MSTRKEAQSIDAYLILLSIKPRQNRYRYYRIRIQAVNVLGSFYLLTFSWGRLHQTPQHQRKICYTDEKLQQVLRTILRIRKRHQYQILECSAHFPPLDILQEWPHCTLPNEQLVLF